MHVWYAAPLYLYVTSHTSVGIGRDEILCLYAEVFSQGSRFLLQIQLVSVLVNFSLCRDILVSLNLYKLQ